MLRTTPLCTLLRLPPRAWQVPALLMAALFMASCTTTPKIEGVPSDLPDIPLYGSAATPPHSMAKGDYPFDANGNYVTAWAAQGSSSASSSSSGHAEEMPPEPVKESQRPRGLKSKVEVVPPKRSAPEEPAPKKGGAPRSQATKSKSEDAPAKKKPVADEDKPKTKHKSSDDDKPKAKKKSDDDDKPKPKKKSSSSGGGGSSKYVVKSTDTLEGIARKFGTTEAKLKAANGLKSDVIRDGRALTIPK